MLVSKTYIITAVCFLITTIHFGQNIEEARKVVNMTIESINSQSAEKLKQNISNDFTIAGQKGDIARLVLTQLFVQLNDEVISFEEISKEIDNSNLLLKYNMIYKSMGSKEATFLFNKNSLLTELELFNMEVKTMEGEAKVEKPKQKVIEIPFTMTGNLIKVKVILDGEEKVFLFDSGSPKVVLNSNYLENRDYERRISSSKGVGGNISGMDIQKVEELILSEIKLLNQDLLTMDLSHLEKELNSEVHGLIGFDLIKDYDVLFDYQNKKIILIQPSFFETYKTDNLHGNNLQIVSLQMNAHLPVVECRVSNKTLKFGIDSGAESNLIDDDLFPFVESQLKQIRIDELIGANSETKTVKKGYLSMMRVGNKEFKKLTTVVSDISHLNEGYSLNLDGLIGYEILSKQKTLISFERKEMIFID